MPMYGTLPPRKMTEFKLFPTGKLKGEGSLSFTQDWSPETAEGCGNS